MTQIPDELRYTKEHEWLRLKGDTATIGITHHAQDQLGDVVFVELPQVGAKLQAGKPFGTVESVKAVSDLFAPVTAEVVAVNDTLVKSPELVNSDPYGEGWMLEVRVTDRGALQALMDAASYALHLGH